MILNTLKTVQVEVDTSYAFDMLSILMVKQERINGQENHIAKLVNGLANQLSYEHYWVIRESDEYMMLYEANLALFDGVEKVRHGAGMGAKEFDDLNQARHRAKQALQRRFWGSELTEMKT